jgi:TolB-like protein
VETSRIFQRWIDGKNHLSLSQLAPERLAVIARTSAMIYKGTRKSIAEIGRELGVDYALEGSVRRERDRVRISAQLIRASDQTHVWALNYDRELKDVLTVQSELGRAIAEQVQIRLTPQDHASRAEAGSMDQAYDAYLHGRFHLRKVTRPNLRWIGSKRGIRSGTFTWYS